MLNRSDGLGRPGVDGRVINRSRGNGEEEECAASFVACSSVRMLPLAFVGGGGVLISCMTVVECWGGGGEAPCPVAAPLSENGRKNAEHIDKPSSKCYARDVRDVNSALFDPWVTVASSLACLAFPLNIAKHFAWYTDESRGVCFFRRPAQYLTGWNAAPTTVLACCSPINCFLRDWMRNVLYRHSYYGGPYLITPNIASKNG